jgi:DNA-binding transcriptional regulator YdaS (Cro superfamily)
MDAKQRKIAKQALKEAVSLVGSQEELAKRLGVKQQHVSYWLKNNGLPAEKVAQAEQAVDRKITRQQFRPDIFQAPTQEGAN